MQERSADVNAAYWKAIPEAFETDGIEDVGVTSCAIDKKRKWHETFQNGSKCITL